MHLARPLFTGLLLDGHREERVGEANPPRAQRDHLCVNRRLEIDRLTKRRLEQLGRRVRAHRRDEQRVSDTFGQHAKALGEKLAEILGDRKCAVELDAPAAVLERSGDVEGEERIPAGHLVKPPQRRPRERHAQARAEQLVQRTQAQRADADPGDSVRQRALQLERRTPAAVAASRHQHTDGLHAKAPHSEPDQVRRRRIEPLHVVDREHDRAPSRKRPERVEERERDRPSIRRRLRLVGKQQGDLERRPLG